MLPVLYVREREGYVTMQNITDLQKTLQPVFERHHTEKVYLTSTHKNNMNFYVVGCTRAGLPALREEIVSALQCSGGVTLNHVEAEMMIDGSIRDGGVLIYDTDR